SAQHARLAVPGVSPRLKERAIPQDRRETMKRRLLWLGPLLLMFFGCQESREQAAAARPSASSVSSASAGATCEHGVPATLCPKCNPQLAAVFKAKGNWCPEHGFPESFCPICHPNAKAPHF